MRRRGGVLVVLAVLAAAASAGVASGRQLPQLRLLSRSPVTVTGAHFAPRERVKVRFGALVQTVKVNTLGSFVARFAVHSDPCNDTLVVTAVGAGGETARLKAFARMCAPAP